MEMRVDKIRRVLELVKPAVPKNPSLKILNNVRFMDKQLTANNLETIVVVDIPEMNGDAFLLPYRQIIELLKHLPGDLVLKIENDEKFVKLSWAGGRASYPIADVKDYPDTPNNDPVCEGPLDGDLLIRAMTDALLYTAKEETGGKIKTKTKTENRPILQGVHLYLGDIIQVAGADGFRCTFESLKMGYPEKQTIAVPAYTVSTLEYLWHKQPGKPALGQSLVAQLTAKRPLILAIWPERVRMKFGDVTIISDLITGNPPDILQLISGFKEEVKVKLFGPELLLAVQRLANIAKESSDMIYLKWDDKTMVVAAQSAESGSSMTEVPVEPGAQPGRICLKHGYLVEYLTGKEGFVTIGTKDRSSPAVFHFGQKPLVAIMPMKAEWSDDPKPEPVEETKTETPANEAKPEGEDETEAEDEKEEGEEETETETETAAAAPE